MADSADKILPAAWWNEKNPTIVSVCMHPGIYSILILLLESPGIVLVFQYTPGKSP